MATYWENSCSFGLRYVSWYKSLIVSLFFSQLGFWSGNLFLIAPFPDLCLLVPFNGHLTDDYMDKIRLRLLVYIRRQVHDIRVISGTEPSSLNRNKPPTKARF